METAEFLKMLPKEKQLYFNDLVKQTIRELNPEFTKATEQKHTELLQTTELIKMLPEEKQLYFNDLVKQMIREWDPDFTKVTDQERAELLQASEEMKNGDYVTEDEIDWD